MLTWRSSGIVLPWLLLFAALPSVSSELPVETFFRNFEVRDAQLSPSGRYLASLSPRGRRVGLVVVDLEARASQWAFVSPTRDVEGFEWMNEERLVFVVMGRHRASWDLLAVNRDGKQFRRLPSRCRAFRDSGRVFRYFGLVPGSDEEILVECCSKATAARRFPHLARVNVYSGRVEPEIVNPGDVQRWLPDHRGVAWVGGIVEGDRVRVVHRTAAGEPWQTLATYGFTKDGIHPIAFTADNQSLLVGWGGGEDTLGLYRFDLEQRKPAELLFRHKEVDVSGVNLHPRSHELTGVAFETERPQVFWFDPEYRQLQASLDQAFPDCLNVLKDESRDGSKLLFLSTRDRNPGTYYLVDGSTKTWKKLFDVAPWIPVEQMAEMKPLSYRSRDGLLLHGYLTLPAHGPRTNLPLVINPHGGPHWRDSWGFDPEVQFLANRGYAVLRVNFRGSSGYGLAFERAGDKQRGRKMQDDLTDGVKWAIAQGIADPKRVAILGGSYGGYAAMAGLAFTPELYRCGVNIAGVTDIDTFLKTTDYATGAESAYVGDPDREKEQLEAVSPLNFAECIQAPVFLAYGKLDRNVPIAQGKEMAAELKKHGKTYELMIRKDEGHGFAREENQVELYRRLDAFLKRYLR